MSSIEISSLANGVLEVGDAINYIVVDGVRYDVTRMFVVTDAMLNARVGSVVKLNVTRGAETLTLEIEITQSSLAEIV